NRDPAFGPRSTTSAPVPAGISLRSRLTSSSTGSTGSAGWKVTVVGSSRLVSSTAPHDEQKFDPSGFRCPQLLQYTSPTATYASINFRYASASSSAAS